MPVPLPATGQPNWAPDANAALTYLDDQTLALEEAIENGLSPWVVSGNLPAVVTVTGDSASGAWTVVGDLGATVTLEG